MVLLEILVIQWLWKDAGQINQRKKSCLYQLDMQHVFKVHLKWTIIGVFYLQVIYCKLYNVSFTTEGMRSYQIVNVWKYTYLMIYVCRRVKIFRWEDIWDLSNPNQSLLLIHCAIYDLHNQCITCVIKIFITLCHFY